MGDTEHSRVNASMLKGIDVVKFIMALLVMEIHLQATNVLPSAIREWCIRPLLLIPVPVFFVISSFFLFKKLHTTTSPLSVLIKFLRRIVALYAFWIVAWTPYLIAKKAYYFTGIEGATQFLTDVLFGEVFGNSWFFGALIMGSIVVYAVSRCLNDKIWWLLPCALFAYLQTVPLLPDSATAPVVWYSHVAHSPYLSFPYSIIWITAGYYLAKPGVMSWLKVHTAPWWIWTLTIVSISATGLGTVVSVFTLPLAVTATFSAFFFWQPSISATTSKWLRNTSIIIYVLHGGIEKIFRIYLHFEHGPLLYLLILAICLTLATLIISLSQKKGFKWLHAAY